MATASPVESWLRDAIDSLIGLGPAVRRDEPDAVHKARTMTRRLRAVLPLVPGDAARGLRSGLQRYGRVLGAARDLEVRAELAAQLLEDITDDDETDAAHTRLIDEVRAEYAGAHAEIVAFLDGPEYRRLVAQLEEIGGDAASLDDLGEFDKLDELDVQHAARKHARAMRYLAEALGDEETARIGAQLQDAFGAHRDYTLLARSLEGETDESLSRVRDAARARGQASLGSLGSLEKD